MEHPQPGSPPVEPTHDPPPAPLHPSPDLPEPPQPSPQPSPDQPEPGQPGPQPERDPPLYPAHDRVAAKPYIPDSWTPDLPLDEVVFDESRVPG